MDESSSRQRSVQYEAAAYEFRNSLGTGPAARVAGVQKMDRELKHLSPF